MPVNPKVYIDRLIKALAEHERYYNVSSSRYYSERMGRYCMKYRLEDKQTGFKIDVFNKIEILKYLVREFSEVTGREVPEACLQPLDDKEPEPPKKNLGGRPRKKRGVYILENYKQKVTPKKKKRGRPPKKKDKDTKDK